MREEDDLSSGLPSLSVTPADLASALASIGTDQSDSQASSMRYMHRASQSLFTKSMAIQSG